MNEIWPCSSHACLLCVESGEVAGASKSGGKVRRIKLGISVGADKLHSSGSLQSAARRPLRSGT